MLNGTLRETQGSVNPQTHLSGGLRSVDDRVVRPQAEPVIRTQGRHVMSEEEKDADEGQKQTDGLHVLPKHGKFHLHHTHTHVSR